MFNAFPALCVRVLWACVSVADLCDIPADRLRPSLVANVIGRRRQHIMGHVYDALPYVAQMKEAFGVDVPTAATTTGKTAVSVGEHDT